MEINLLDLQPSQFYLSEAKIERIETWFDPAHLENFKPIPIKKIDGKWILVDGHTRAFLAWQAGLASIPIEMIEENLNWDFYRFCVSESQLRGIFTVADLEAYVLNSSDYEEQWLGWCQDNLKHF